MNGQLDQETTDRYTLFVEATNSAQCRAEQGVTSEDREDILSDSESGSEGMLFPEPTPGENANVSLDIAFLTVSGLAYVHGGSYVCA